MEKERPSHKWTSHGTNYLLWDSSWSSEQFYGNFTVRGAKKAYSSEVFDSIIAEFKENIQFKEKKSKNLKAKKERN